MNGIWAFASERGRQISEEGWTAEKDDTRARGELLRAALAYCVLALRQIGQARGSCYPVATGYIPPFWPWESEGFKGDPDPARNIQKAGALLGAEWDRIARLRGHDIHQTGRDAEFEALRLIAREALEQSKETTLSNGLLSALAKYLSEYGNP